MALVKLSGLITGIVGPVQGSTFQPYRGQTMMRTTGRPLRSPRQNVQPQKQIFAAVRGSWSSLTSPIKESWNNAAKNFPFKSKTGELYKGSGYQLFISCNLVLVKFGEPISVEPPVVNNSGIVPSGEEVEIIGMQDKKLVAVWDDTSTSGDILMDISVSRPLPPGRNSTPSSFTSVSSARIDLETVEISQQELLSIWGFVPRTPVALWVRFRAIDISNGFIGVSTYIRIEADFRDDE